MVWNQRKVISFSKRYTNGRENVVLGDLMVDSCAHLSRNTFLPDQTGSHPRKLTQNESI